MIKQFVEQFNAQRTAIRRDFNEQFPDSYRHLIRRIVGWVSPLDVDSIICSSSGGYDGELLYVIGSSDEYVHDQFYVRISYGSCSGCDTMIAIQDQREYEPAAALDGMMTLALHIVQKLRQFPDNTNKLEELHA